MTAEIQVKPDALNSPPAASSAFDSVASSNILDSERYRLQQLIGAGAFGSVYAGRDLVLGRAVAVKIPKLEKQDAIENFLNEMRSAAQLRHPHIISIFDSGIDQKGHPFAVYELVEGRSLAELAKAGQLDRFTIVRLIAEAAEAVHYSHRQSLVHRDLKPSNIMVNAEGQALITDFGLAVNEANQRGRSGDIAGSPAYMSPEQVRGEAHRMDGRTDIWSLGVILYELLTGRRPFKGKNHEEIFEEILHREPKPPRQVNDTLPKELEACILKCLEKSVKSRYTTAGDLASDLRQWINANQDALISFSPLSEEFVGKSTVRINTTATKVKKPERKVKTRVTTASIVAMIALVLSAGIWAFVQTEPSPDLPPQSTGPAGWQPLLVTEPKVIALSKIPDDTTWKFDKHKRSLSITTNEMAAFSLGEASDRTYRIRLEVSQFPWAYGAGVFIGYQLNPNASSDKRKYHCQSIEFLPNPKSTRQPYIARSYMTFTQDGRLFERHT
ncbi:MAG: serine/threonine-protein kinase, partial [Planctomycetaceae bacterium]